MIMKTLSESYHNLNFIKILPEKLFFFQGWSWFKFNNLELALGMALKFNTNMAKSFKKKSKSF